MKLQFKCLVIVGVMVSIMTILIGCGFEQDKTLEQTTIKVGVTPGAQAEIMKIVQKKAGTAGLKIKIIEFTDYIEPNIALNNGEIDVNSYQHQPFLDAQVNDRGYKIEALAKTILFPMGIYAKTLKSLSEVNCGAVVAIPNDPTNGGRALRLLEQTGLIKLNANAGLSATPADIEANPWQLQIKELVAEQLPIVLNDVDLTVINSNYAVAAGFIPVQDALFLEDDNSPYVNILVVQSKDKAKPIYQKFIKVYQSAEVRQYVKEHLNGAGLVAW